MAIAIPFSVPRPGKGIVAAAMMLGFKQQQPKSWLGSCTIKQFNQEDWYWQWSDQQIALEEYGRSLLSGMILK